MKRRATHWWITIGLVGMLSSCYYENEETLYPAAGATPSTCDTADVSFTNKLAPVIQQNCISCHSGAAASGGINLSTHAQVSANIDEVIGAISHASGFSPMPQGGSKLPDCTIALFRAWRNAGAPNN